MPLPLQTPSAFGHDPTDPPFRVIDATPPEPVRDESIGANEAGVRQRFRNISMPEAPPLQLTVTERFAEPPSEEARAAAEEQLLARLSRLRLYYRVFEPPPGIEYQYEDLGIEPQPGEEVRPSFDNIRDLERDVQSLIVWTLELVADRPREDEPPLAVGVTLDPSINYNQLHGYVAKCCKSAWAYVRATAGGVRLRVTRNGVTVGVASDWAGGGTSACVGASTSTKATFDAAVRGLKNGSYYYISYGWIRGTGGGCP
jgi:hypothetical protein